MWTTKEVCVSTNIDMIDRKSAKMHVDNCTMHFSHASCLFGTTKKVLKDIHKSEKGACG